MDSRTLTVDEGIGYGKLDDVVVPEFTEFEYNITETTIEAPKVAGDYIVWRGRDAYGNYSLYMTEIPEPSAAILLAAGGAGILMYLNLKNSKRDLRNPLCP